MNKDQVMIKVKEMLEEDRLFVLKEVERLLVSGGVDPAGYEDNFRLPKILLFTAYGNLRIQRRPLNNVDCKAAKNLNQF